MKFSVKIETVFPDGRILNTNISNFNPVVHGGEGGGGIYPPPVGFFLITFFSLKLRA